MTIVLPRVARGTHYISIRYYGNTQITASTTAKVSLHRVELSPFGCGSGQPPVGGRRAHTRLKPG